MEMNEQNEHDDGESLDNVASALEDGDLLEEMVRAFVSEPNAVKVTTTHDGDCKVLTVSVADDDRGKVIGKQGRVHVKVQPSLRSGQTIAAQQNARQHI